MWFRRFFNFPGAGIISKGTKLSFCFCNYFILTDKNEVTSVIWSEIQIKLWKRYTESWISKILGNQKQIC